MKVVPVKDLRYLTMLFPIPSFKAHYKTNPGMITMQYVSSSAKVALFGVIND